MNIKPQSAYDIRNAGQYGLSEFDDTKTRQEQDKLATRDINDTTRMARESALAGGSFNPDVSVYGATEAAKNARNRAMVDLDKYKYEQQFRLLDSLLGIDTAKLNRENLEFNKEQYNDQKPNWLSDIMNIAGGVFPFLADGGVIKDSRYYLENTGGVIPWDAVNSDEEYTGDNTLIKAKPEEAITNVPATGLLGEENVNFLNNTAMQLIGDNDMNIADAIKSNINSVKPQSAQEGGFGSMLPGSKNINIGGGIIEKLKSLWSTDSADGAVNAGGVGSAALRADGGAVGSTPAEMPQELQDLIANFDRLNTEAVNTANQTSGLKPGAIEQDNARLLEAFKKLRGYKQQREGVDKTRTITIKEEPKSAPATPAI